MKRVLLIFLAAVLVSAGGHEAFPRSLTKKAVAKAPVTPSAGKMNHDCASCHALSKQDAGAIFKDIGEVIDVKMSPVKGLYEVTVRQSNRQATAYLDFGKKLLLPGPVFEIATKRPLTPAPEELPKVLSKAELEKIPVTNSIIMGNPSGKKRMFVFTDPDCPFCGKLHDELKTLVALEPDLVIYVKMFPLKMHPAAYDKARVILGSGSPEILEKAFAGEKLPEPGDKDPKEPVDETLKLGESLGIDGTPAIVLPGGRLITGARDAASLRTLLTE